MQEGALNGGNRRPGDETTYRQSAAFRQFQADCCKPDLSCTGRAKPESFPGLPVRTDPKNYAALGLISIVFALAVFGMVNCRTPFFRVAVVFSASTLAGRSTIRRIWFEQNSE